MASNGRLKDGRFGSGNSFARGHGAPRGNQNAKGHGAPARNTNAVKTGEFMRFEEGETPYDRLRGDETEIKGVVCQCGHLLMRARREMIEARQRLKAASISKHMTGDVF